MQGGSPLHTRLNGWASSPITIVLLTLIGGPLAPVDARRQASAPPAPVAAAPAAAGQNPLASFTLPPTWQDQFWSSPEGKRLLEIDLKELADLVPVQAGARYCRCPACPTSEQQDPLEWSITKPAVVTCRLCKAEFPNEQIPAKEKNAVPEELIEVGRGIVHHYPYHPVPETQQVYPDERLYLAAKRDYQAAQFLAKAALYAAVRYRDQPPAERDARLGQLAAVLLLRFAQVYPDYATHFDQPGQSQFFQPADLPPPYRRGYQTGKWDSLSSCDVPLGLVIAHACLRDDPVLEFAGKLLDDPHPRHTIEQDLFLASAQFVLRQSEEYSEASLQAYRGVLAVGRLLDDPELMHEGVDRLRGFAERGFYHDGFYREGDRASHRRVLALIDGWIDRLIKGYSDPASYQQMDTVRFQDLPGAQVIPQIVLARRAGAVLFDGPGDTAVQEAGWPGPETAYAVEPNDTGCLLGGAGIACLEVGTGGDQLQVELRGQGDFDAARSNRLALRVSIGGQPVLGDLDDLPPTFDGWDRATASHNTVVIDGLNQRETHDLARRPAPGAEVRFFAADPDFQVALFADRYAYPTSSELYRHTVVAAAGAHFTYALSVFEVAGGLQHDQIWHSAAGQRAHWLLPFPLRSGPPTLLPPSIILLPNARAADGRWFVQAYGSFANLRQTMLQGPVQTVLETEGRPALRLHLLGDYPSVAMIARSPDPSPDSTRDEAEPGRASLILRRSSASGSTLKTAYVTMLEPIAAGGSSPIVRAGRVQSEPGTTLLAIDTEEGPESLFVNNRPGVERQVSLADGRVLETDALVVRVQLAGLTIAGGTFARLGGHRVEQTSSIGTIQSAHIGGIEGARGAFHTGEPVVDPESLVGRCLVIRHGDGTTRAWTIQGVLSDSSGESSWIHVREEPAFQINPESGEAVYYQFPRVRLPGPHAYVVSKIAR